MDSTVKGNLISLFTECRSNDPALLARLSIHKPWVDRVAMATPITPVVRAHHYRRCQLSLHVSLRMAGWISTPAYLAAGFLPGVLALQVHMMRDMWHFTFYHPWSTTTLSMILLARPTAFLYQRGHHHTMLRLFAFSNPFLIWLGLGSLILQGIFHSIHGIHRIHQASAPSSPLNAWTFFCYGFFARMGRGFFPIARNSTIISFTRCRLLSLPGRSAFHNSTAPSFIHSEFL